MAQVVYPSPFPLPNCISETEPYGPYTVYQTEASLAEIMECYWLVKTWRLTILDISSPSDSLAVYSVPNWFDPENPPISERELVCGYSSEEFGYSNRIGASLNMPYASKVVSSYPTGQTQRVISGTAFGGIFSGNFFVGQIPAVRGADGNYYMAVYLEAGYYDVRYKINGDIDNDSSSSYAGASFYGPPFQEFSIPIYLRDSVLSVPMWVDTTGGIGPASQFKIEAAEYWPYNP